MIDPATIERLAREAGLYFAKDDFGDVPEVEATHPGSLGRFAALVEAHALERAAKVCDVLAESDMTGYGIAEDCAAAIRALP